MQGMVDEGVSVMALYGCRHLFLQVFLVFLSFFFGAHGAADELEARLANKHVLVLYSYHPGFPTSSQSLDGIRSVFGAHGPQIDMEYLDAKRIYDAQSVANFLTLLRYKRHALPPYDLLMVADDYALRLALEEANDLFKGIPVVFYGVNDVELAVAQNTNAQFTGVVEASSFAETLALNARLQPQRKQIQVLVDGTLSGQADLRTLLKLQGKFPEQTFHVLSLADQTWEQVQARLEALGDDDAILFLSAYQDSTGDTKSFSESLQWARAATTVPIWHLWEHGVGGGMLGGVLISHREQGRQAALMAKRILLGESPSAIPVLEKSPNVPVFDYALLDDYGIAESALPEDTVLLNVPDTLWRHYRREIQLSLFGLLALVGFTCWLIRQNRRLVLTQAELKASRDGLRTLSQTVEQSPMPVIITDPQARIEYVNAAFQFTTGYPQADVLGQTPQFLSAGETGPSTYDELWKTIRSGRTWSGELLNKRRNGETYWAKVLVSAVLDGRGQITHYFGIQEDISQQKEQEAKILYQAHYDALTGLPNRFLVLDRLAQAILEANREGHKAVLMFLDLDDFKKVNDRLGHEEGDELLRQASVRLKSLVRGVDTVGRLGGDEFVIILTDVGRVADALPVANNVLAAFDKPFLLAGREISLSTSIGIAVFPDDGSDASTLLRKADMAMYESKNGGGNRFNYYTETMSRVPSDA